MQLQLVRLVAKLMGHRNFKVGNGNLYIWTVPMIFHSATVLPKLYYESKNKKKIKEIFYYMGKLESFNGTIVLIKRFGMKHNQKSFLQLFLDQGVMLGIARGKIYQKESKIPRVVIGGKVNYGHFYKEQYGLQKEPVCYYMRGVLAGGVEAIYSRKDLFCVETECVAKGDSICKFEIKPIADWKGDPLFKKQFRQKPAYYEKFTAVENLSSLLTEKS